MLKKIQRTLSQFIQSQSLGGVVLALAAIVALVASNTGFSAVYERFVYLPVELRIGADLLVLAKPLVIWVNDLWMAVFFFLVGLEIKREMIEGELASPSQALLPAGAAIGGMVVPALIYTAINWGDGVALRGWAIPMATDIAFALGILVLLGSRVPSSLKVFLTAVAIIDDLGAILVIAFFYTDHVAPVPLLCALVPAALLISIFIPWAVTPLLMVGGAYLCFEGFEKLAHKFLHSHAEDQAHEEELLKALSDPAVDLMEVERDKVKGAIRTDFVLSAEIIAITLGTVQSMTWTTQLAVLSSIALLMTFGVYGIVAGIVKMDDAGLYLSRLTGAGAGRRALRSFGRGLLRAAPVLMKVLAVVGTAAMFLVGGGILVHGIGPLHHAVDAVLSQLGTAGSAVAGVAGALLPITVEAVTGILAGAVVFVGVTLVARLRKMLGR